MDDKLPRSLKSVQSRWGTLNRNMSRFAACVQQVKMIRETGKTIEDQFQDALILYNSETGSAFVNTSSYNIVKHSPKWTDNPQYTEYCGHKRKSSSDELPNELVDLDAIRPGDAISNINLAKLNRPAGSKQAKRARSANDPPATHEQMLENSTSTANATLRIANHLDRASSSLEAMLELSLLQTDTSRLNQHVREALEADKEALLQRRAACRAAE
ncbi:hypothetical protein DFH28DRAFT_1071449 [Melampsora americana]|nr:hypothetical protein DFH28DRAFT_1071449 [Melampsora americana]